MNLKFWQKKKANGEPLHLIGANIGDQWHQFVGGDMPGEIRQWFESGFSSDSFAGSLEGTALKNATVAGCVSLIAGAIAQSRWERHEVNDKGELTRKPDRERERQLNLTFNEQYSAPQAWEKIVREVLLYGDSFVKIERNRLVPLRHSSVQVTESPRDEEKLLYRWSPRDSKRQDQMFDAKQILHFTSQFYGDRGESFSAYRTIARALTISELMQSWTYFSFAGGAAANFVIHSDDVNADITPENVENIKETFRQRIKKGFPESMLPIALRGGLKMTPINLTPTEAALIQQRTFQIEEILRAFRVPSFLMNIPNPSAWGTGLQAIGSMFRRTTIGPMTVRKEAEVTRKLTQGEKTKYRYVLNTDVLVESTFGETVAALRTAIGGQAMGGMISINEAREKLGMSPKEGEKYESVYLPTDQLGDAAGETDLLPAPPEEEEETQPLPFEEESDAAADDDEG